MTALAVRDLPTASIRPGNNDRKDFDRAELERLAASIDADGLLQPITVRELPGGMFEIVAGERRWRAVTEVLAWETIDAIVRALDDDAASRAMAVENLVRVDLDPVAEALAYRSRMERHELDVAGVARWCSVSPARVKGRLALLALCPEVLELVRVGQFPIGHAATCARLPSDFQLLAVRAYGERDLTYLAFRALCDELAARASEISMFDADSFWTVVDETAAANKKVRPVTDGAELMDSEELAELLGLTPRQFAAMRQRAHKYIKLRGMPEPMRTISRHPVWRRADVEAWAAAFGVDETARCPRCAHRAGEHRVADGARWCTHADCAGGRCFERVSS